MQRASLSGAGIYRLRYYWRNTLGWAFPRLRSGAKSIGSRGRKVDTLKITKQTQLSITHFDPATCSVDLGGRAHASLSHNRFVARQIRGFSPGSVVTFQEPERVAHGA